MNSDSAYTFPGYRVLAQLGDTHNSSVFRAQEDGRKRTVIIKVIKTVNPSIEQAARIRYEFELIRQLEIDGIIKPIDLISYDGMLVLILEDFAGVSLKEMIADGISIQDFLKQAIRLADILGALHRCNVSHRNIKPSNILCNPESDSVKITDFGISAIMLADEALADPNLSEGTLAYISPEQTGRMNLAMDYRTDFYSLGVTFYEMLTGTAPFRSTDPLEIIHAHIAKVPPPLQKLNSEIPGPVVDIVMKLLSKSAAERYQSGSGLAADLQKCLRQLKINSRIEPFQLAVEDISLRFMIPQLLVGREGELDRLFAAFERVSHGSAEMILVNGEPGIGKSVLVHEVQKPIMAKQGYFLSGKYDQFQRSVPYSAIIQAFQNLIRQLLTENHEQLLLRKKQLLAALGPNGKIIADVIPEIERIIGKQGDVPELGPEETKNRFNLVFKNFVHLFMDERHPLVLFLDDLQWADSASLNLIQTILSDGSLRHMLFIGAYRDTEVAAHHPLIQTLESLETSDLPIQRIHLGTLAPKQINRLIVSMADCPPDTSLPLARIVYEKTKGSPFFIHQFLKTLHDKCYIRLDHDRGWTWDLDKIHSMPVTDNVVAFMAERLHELPAATLELLQLCACIGHQFDVQTVVSITQSPLDEIYAFMDALMRENLIIGTGNTYRFYHDRIQEAAYSLLTQVKREELHHRIGTLELGRTSGTQLFNRVFYICDQLNQAAPSIETRKERIRLAQLNLTAGIKARESTAYAAAVNYLGMGSSFLPEDAWVTDYKLTYGLFAEQMQCQYLNRNFQEAERLFAILIANAKTEVDIARAYIAMIRLYTNTRPARKTIELGIEALKRFGIHIDMNVGKAAVAVELLKAWRLLKKIGVENILDLPVMQDKTLIVLNQLMLSMCTAAFFVNPNLYALLSLKSANAGLKQGLIPHTTLSLIALANILQNAIGNYDLAFRIGETALRLNQRFNNLQIAGILHHVFAFHIHHWKKHLKFELEIFPKAFELAVNAGEFVYAGHSIMAFINLRILIGHRLDDVFKDLKKYNDFISLVKSPFILMEYHHVRQIIRALKGEIPLGREISGDGFFDYDRHIDELKAQGNLFAVAYLLISRLFLLVLYKRFDEAYPVAAALDKIIDVPMGTLFVAYHYFYYSLVLIALLKQGRRPVKKYKALIRRNQRKLRKWAAACPENFKHQYDLIEAELAGLKGNFQTAVHLHNAAISGARDNEFSIIEAFACEYLADFYLTCNLQEEAGLFLRRAYDIYDVWGASSKTEDMKAHNPTIFTVTSSTVTANHASGPLAAETKFMQMDFSTVMKVSQLISSEIMLDRLLAQIMDISIANAGAQRGYLILESNDQLKVQASQTVDTGETLVLQDAPLEECQGLSPAIVYYVFHSAKPIILGNAMNAGPFTNDPHVVTQRCKSVLCIPLLNKGVLMGILYMENNLADEVFTPGRVEILRIIAAQAAISLQNAKLYSDIASEMAIRKEAEEAVRRSERKYRTILQEMEEGYYEIDLKGNFVDSNEAIRKIRGFEMTGRSYKDFQNPEEAQNNFELFKNVYKTGNPFKSHGYEITHKDGSTRYVEISGYPLKDDNGKIISFWGIAHDRTEQKTAQKALQKSEEHYRLLVNNANDAIYITQQGRIKFHNPKMSEMTGYSETELTKMVFADLVYPEDKARVHDEKQKSVVEGRIPEVFSFRIINRKKATLWVELNAVSITWEGRPATLNFLRDVTQHKKTEARLLQAQKMEAIGTLAGGIAHDFNNILAAILGFAELVMEEVPPNPIVEDNLNEILIAGKRAKDLVHQILSFARQTDEKIKPVMVAPIAKEALKLIRSSIPTTIDIRQNIASKSPIMGNPTQIHQIFMNLCTNAAHAMEQSGGKLTVDLVDVQMDEGLYQIELPPGNYLKLAVSDTGCGIRPEILDSIFDPYFTTKGVGEGTGMGLSMVKGIVEKYGGLITVDSELKRGSAFTVYFPIAKSDLEPVMVSVENIARNGARILFVDDEVAIVKMVGRTLEKMGHHVTVRTSSIEALNLFRAKFNEFDLILTDMTMPNMTGDRLAQEIIRIRPDIPVILCTGYSKQINQEFALKMGIKAFLYKPINKSDLAATIDNVLEKKI